MLLSFDTISSFLLDLLEMMSMVRREEEVVGVGKCHSYKTLSFFATIGEA